MDVETKTMGKVSVAKENLIEFPSGLFGFEDFHNYALINSEYEPFLYLQSLDAKELAFLLVDPFLIAPEYELDLDDNYLAEIGIETPSDVLLFAIVTVPAGGKPITANLQGPLIINRRNNQAMQAILTNTLYTTKTDIVKSLAARKEGGR